jgi:tetratricopeptide (TPR) repeat protein
MSPPMFTGNSAAPSPNSILLRVTPILALLFLVMATQSKAQRTLDTKAADELVAYANRLALRGDAVKIGKNGLAITGQILSGEAVRRPSDALARAAEIYAENASEEKDNGMINTALGLWKRISKPEFAIPYLRIYSRNAKESRDPFALYCNIQLAELYQSIGDSQSADEIYSQYIEFDPIDVLEVYAVAETAKRMLELKRINDAKKLAQTAITACDPTVFTHEPGGNGYTTAINVLKRIPGAEIPSIGIASGPNGSSTPKAIQRQDTNPRALLAEGNMASQLGDYPDAITKWQEYQRTFPNEDQSRQIGITIAKTYEKINQMDRALEAYSVVEARYPEFAEWWQAVLGKAQLVASSGKPDEAKAYLISSLNKSSTPESSARVTLALAEACIKMNKPDDAVEYYLTLMTKYADQDASRYALTNLMKAAPRSQDWKRLATGIKSWFSSNFTLGNRSEFKNLSITDASRIRRLVLSFYFKSNDVKGGVRWLAEIRRVSDQTHQEYITRDEAWLYGNGALSISQKAEGTLTPRMLEENIGYGIGAWELAPKTEEGLLGLKAACTLATNRYAAKRINKDLEEKLRDLMKSEDTKQEAYTMLLGYYEFLGEKKALEDLKRKDLEPK